MNAKFAKIIDAFLKVLRTLIQPICKNHPSHSKHGNHNLRNRYLLNNETYHVSTSVAVFTPLHRPLLHIGIGNQWLPIHINVHRTDPIAINETKRSNNILTSIASGESFDTPTPTFEPLGIGIQLDFTRCLPYYLSDITDGLNAQSLATTLFILCMPRSGHWIRCHPLHSYGGCNGSHRTDHLHIALRGAKLAQSRYGAEVALSSLSLPTKFATTTGRPWLVPLLNLPVWARWCAALPALLATILLYLDQNITARLVNNPRYKMIKGRDTENMMDGMHGDMLVLSFLTGLTSLLGLPWMAGATTRSAAHVRSLLITNEDGSIKRTLENRVSGAAIHAMIGACVLFSAPRTLLSYIPLPVLSGVFLYLGFTSLQGLELWDRTLGLFRDASSAIAKSKRWSGLDAKFTTGLTVVQIACVLLMMKVTKSSRFGVISPLIIALLPLVRRVLIRSRLIPKPAMDVLDS